MTMFPSGMVFHPLSGICYDSISVRSLKIPTAVQNVETMGGFNWFGLT